MSFIYTSSHLTNFDNEINLASSATWAPFQHSIRRLITRSRDVSKPRDLYLELSDRSEIWQTPRQQCCRCACQIWKRYDNLNCQSRGSETSRDLTIRHLIGYWNEALRLSVSGVHYWWRDGMETLSALLFFSWGKPPIQRWILITKGQ